MRQLSCICVRATVFGLAAIPPESFSQSPAVAVNIILQFWLTTYVFVLMQHEKNNSVSILEW